MLQIDIRRLERGVHELEISPTAEDLELDPKDFTDLNVGVRLDIGGSRMYVQFWVSATASLICDRTLEAFTQPIEGSFAVVFVPPKEIDAENEDDRLFPLEDGAEEIDLTDIVRDTLLLSVPIRKIAPGAEDEDLPTSFGAPDDGDEDPRWAALKALGSSSKK